MPGTGLEAKDTIVCQTDMVPDLMKINNFKDKTVTN